jgi:hypothetical protein
VFFCCVGCLCDELITRQEDPTDCGASLCVITKPPRERGGHSPRWAEEPQMMMMMMMMMINC